MKAAAATRYLREKKGATARYLNNPGNPGGRQMFLRCLWEPSRKREYHLFKRVAAVYRVRNQPPKNPTMFADRNTKVKGKKNIRPCIQERLFHSRQHISLPTRKLADYRLISPDSRVFLWQSLKFQKLIIQRVAAGLQGPEMQYTGTSCKPVTKESFVRFSL